MYLTVIGCPKSWILCFPKSSKCFTRISLPFTFSFSSYLLPWNLVQGFSNLSLHVNSSGVMSTFRFWFGRSKGRPECLPFSYSLERCLHPCSRLHFERWGTNMCITSTKCRLRLIWFCHLPAGWLWVSYLHFLSQFIRMYYYLCKIFVSRVT